VGGGLRLLPQNVRSITLSDKRLKMPSNLLQVTLPFILSSGDVASNTVYYEIERVTADIPDMDQSWNNTDAAQKATEAWDQMQASFLPLLSDLITSTVPSWVWNEAVDAGPLHEGVGSGEVGTHPGGNVSDAISDGLSLAVRFQTGLGGRSNHGRIFLCGMNQGLFVDDAPNQLKPGSVVDFNLAADNWQSNVITDHTVAGTGFTTTQVVASFVHNAVLRSPTTFNKVIATNFKDTFFDFQRRRAPAHSRHH
jgi:hypothetical protein